MEGGARNKEDLFSSVVSLNESQFEEGFKDGYKDGLVSGKEEGRNVGEKLGFQVGEELGFYQGCVDVWRSSLRLDPRSFSPRISKRIEHLRELLERYPLLEPENEEVQEKLGVIRLNFKIISATICLGLPYQGYQKATSGSEYESI